MTLFLTRSIYPVFVALGMGGALWGIEAGHSPYAVTIGVNFVGLLVAGILERIHPHLESWNQDHGDTRTDLLHAVFSNLLPIALARATVLGALAELAVRLSRSDGPWPSEWPLVLQLMLALVVGEFFVYWTHRLFHANATGWSFHAVHHRAPRLYWLNGLRGHPVDAAIGFVVHEGVLVLAGAPEAVLVLAVGFIGIHGLLQHSNVRLELGPLEWFVSSPTHHRWHHSPDIHESSHNFGNNLIVWDRVFGTVFRPKDRTPPVILGIGNMPDFPKGFRDQVAYPFRKKKRAPAA